MELECSRRFALAALPAALAALCLCGCVPTISPRVPVAVPIGMPRGPYAASTRKTSQSVPAAGLATLRVENDNGEIRVGPADAATVVIESEFTARGPYPAAALASWAARLKTIVTLDGSTLKVSVSQPPGVPPGLSLSVNHLIHAPRALALDLHSTNGRIAASGREGNVLVRDDNGEVTLREVHGALDLETANGRLTAEQIQAAGKSVSLKSSNGEITFSGTARNLTVESQNGRVDADLAAVPASTRVSSDNGELDLKLPADGAAALDARSDNGEVDVEGEQPSASEGQPGPRNAWKGRLGAGGNRLELRTGNGRIHVGKR